MKIVFKTKLFPQFLLGVIILAVTSCIKDADLGTVADGKNLRIALSNYVADPQALPDEQVIKSAYVYIFNKDMILENPTSIQVSNSPSVVDGSGYLNAEWRVTPGEKYLFVIANPTAEVAAKLDHTLDNIPNKLLSLVTSEANFTNDVDAFGTKGMMMSGPDCQDGNFAKHKFIVPEDGNHAQPVTITRNYARINLKLKVDPEIESRDIKIRKVTLKRQYMKVGVFRQPAYSTVDFKHETSKTPVSEITLSTLYTPIAQFYTAERPNEGADTKPLLLELEAVVDGETHNINVYLCNDPTVPTANKDENPIAIKRNHIYEVKGTITGKGSITLDGITDWEDELVSGDIYGSKLEARGPVYLTPLDKAPYIASTDASTVTYTLSQKAKDMGITFYNGVHTNEPQTVTVDNSGNANLNISAPLMQYDGSDCYMEVAAGNIVRHVRLICNPVVYGQSNCFATEIGGGITFDVKPYYAGKDLVRTTEVATREPMPQSAGVLWQDLQGEPLITGISLVGTNLQVSTSSKPGNAVVAIYSGPNQTGDILWSFHIWNGGAAWLSPDKVKTASYTYGGKQHTSTWAPVNLGATYDNFAANIPDYLVYGLYYQPGRKDPFRGYNTIYDGTGNSIKTVPVVEVEVSDNLTQSIRNPLTFYAIGDDAGYRDWLTNDSQYANLYLWTTPSLDKKTVYDPCPAGWRVPPSGKRTIDSYRAPFLPEIVGSAESDFFYNYFTLDNSDNPRMRVHPQLGNFPFAGVLDYHTGELRKNSLGGHSSMSFAERSDIMGKLAPSIKQLNLNKRNSQNLVSYFEEMEGFGISCDGFSMRCIKE